MSQEIRDDEIRFIRKKKNNAPESRMQLEIERSNRDDEQHRLRLETERKDFVEEFKQRWHQSESSIFDQRPLLYSPIVKKSNSGLIILSIVALLTALLALGLLYLRYFRTPTPTEEISSPSKESFSLLVPEKERDGFSYTERIDTVVNDVMVSLFIPHNAFPFLTIGKPSNDNNTILGFQAANLDDSGKIEGNFMVKGIIISKGGKDQKDGYCALLDNMIVLGSGKKSSYFEQAHNTDGDFFRQYSLVKKGAVVEEGPKNKRKRCALCSYNDRIIVAESQTNESFHDFALALVDLGVVDAISLVGDESFGWYKDRDNNINTIGQDEHKHINENYIVWQPLEAEE